MRRLITNKRKNAKFEDCEADVFKWINEELDGKCVISAAIRRKMLEIVNLRHQEHRFKASYGWLRKFMLRYNLVFRRISG